MLDLLHEAAFCYSQLSIVKGHCCESMGNFRRSMGQAAVIVNLKHISKRDVSISPTQREVKGFAVKPG